MKTTRPRTSTRGSRTPESKPLNLSTASLRTPSFPNWRGSVSQDPRSFTMGRFRAWQAMAHGGRSTVPRAQQRSTPTTLNFYRLLAHILPPHSMICSFPPTSSSTLLEQGPSHHGGNPNRNWPLTPDGHLTEAPKCLLVFGFSVPRDHTVGSRRVYMPALRTN